MPFVSSMPAAVISQLADRASPVDGGEGKPLDEPFGLGFDSKGRLLVVELTQGRLLTLHSDGSLSVVRLDFKGREPFNGPHNLAVLPDGDVLVADTWTGRVRKVEPASGIVSDVPGFGVPAERARAAGPYSITLDSGGSRLYVADLRRIHAIDLRTGTSRAVAGNGQKGIPADGAVAAEAPLVEPRAVAPDSRGNVYILERGGHALRVVDGQGRIRTVVNVSGKKGPPVEARDAREAFLNGPKHLCVDADDNVLIADAENNVVSKYSPHDGSLVRVAGTGKAGTTGVGGPPEACELTRPHGVLVGPDGAIYIADTYNHRVLKIAR